MTQLWSELSYRPFRWASVFDSRIEDGNTASIFKRLKSPERFTGGQTVH
ncbi:hypothetical protein [Acinetobacter bouvetii]|nr:hypothetical protein [Acinetobacter bouvetii]